MKIFILIAISILAAISPDLHGGDPEGKHIFILSGQSNMAGLNPESSFTPTVAKAFGKENVIVIKTGHGGRPIRNWYREWKPAYPTEVKEYGPPHLYDDLLLPRIIKAMQSENIQTVSFVWMQGEADAQEGLGDVYAASLRGLHAQLQHDIGRDDVNFVIGRINDYDLKNERFPHWTIVREAQVEVGEGNPRFAWVDTDDLNDRINEAGYAIINDLHMSVEGYKILGQQFAEKCIDIINKQKR